MEEFLASVVARIAYMLIEALITRLFRAFLATRVQAHVAPAA